MNSAIVPSDFGLLCWPHDAAITRIRSLSTSISANARPSVPCGSETCAWRTWSKYGLLTTLPVFAGVVANFFPHLFLIFPADAATQLGDLVLPAAWPFGAVLRAILPYATCRLSPVSSSSFAMKAAWRLLQRLRKCSQASSSAQGVLFPDIHSPSGVPL